MSKPTEDITTDVLIVGAGPVGLLTARLLEQVGLDYVLMERRPTLHKAPQAHVISSRSLEICRSIGISDKLIRLAGPSLTDSMHVRWVDRLVGRDLGVFSMASDPKIIQYMLSSSPTPTCNLSQDRFEQLLYDHLAQPANIRFEHTWQGCESFDDGYVSTLNGPQGDPLLVKSRYIIGADGAGSAVRSAIGAKMEGPDNIQTYVNIHFSADLRDALNGREGLLYWVMEEECEGIFIAHDIDSNWIFMKTVDADEILNPINEEKFAALLRKAIGADIDLTIHSMNSWRMTAQVSDSYRSEQIFLVGDAAHRFPPTGGIGMNTGIQDAHNLVWKIAMVERSINPALLATYEAERKPVAEVNSAQSLSNAMKMSEVGKTLDTNGDNKISMSDLDVVMADQKHRTNVQEAIDRQSAHFNMSGLDLGFCYTSTAVIVDGAPPESDNPVSKYLPSTTPGARMPHAWLKSDDTLVSTLDLLNYGRLTVLATSPSSGLEAAVSRLLEAGYLIDLATIGADTTLQPADSTFAALFTDQVLLLRPDGHIAARLSNANAGVELENVVDRLFPA